MGFTKFSPVQLLLAMQKDIEKGFEISLLK
jgi:hypothetical protein